MCSTSRPIESTRYFMSIRRRAVKTGYKRVNKVPTTDLLTLGSVTAVQRQSMNCAGRTG